MTGEICVMTINHQFSFWYVLKVDESKSITYQYLLERYMAELYKKIANCPQNAKTTVYTLHPSEISQKSQVSNLQMKVPMNCELLVRIDNISKIKYEPNLSESEAYECIRKAEIHYFDSPWASLKFFKCAPQYSILQYVKLLFRQKKWNKLHDMSSTLLKLFPKNADINYIIAKTYEAFHDTSKALQIYKDTLQFSDSSQILIECTKLYANSDAYLSTLLLNHTLYSDSTDPNVIIQSMKSLFADRKYSESFDAAFRSQKSLIFLIKSFKKNEQLSKYFIQFFRESKIPVKECAELASLFYAHGAVLESLYICRRSVESSNYNPIIVRVYFTLLLNGGLYKTFTKVSNEFAHKVMDEDSILQINLFEFYSIYYGVTFGNPFIIPHESEKTCPKYLYNPDELSEIQHAYIDCACAMASFLFLIGYKIDLNITPVLSTKLFEFNKNMLFWQLRYLLAILFTSSENLFDPSPPTSIIIGDENAMIAAYQTLIVGSEKFAIIPNVIIDLSIWKLRKGHKNGHKNSFWSRIEADDESTNIILELGNVDCEYEVPRLLKKNKFSTVDGAIKEITNIYFHVISKIKNKFPSKRIIIHPVIPTNKYCSAIVYEFNRQIRVKAFENQILFLDIFSKFGPFDIAMSNSKASFSVYLNLLKPWLVIK